MIFNIKLNIQYEYDNPDILYISIYMYSPNIPHADAHIIISNHWHQFKIYVLLLLY